MIVVRNRYNCVVQIELDDKPMCSVWQVKSGPHSTVYINLVVDSTLFMQLIVLLLTRYKHLVPFSQYEESFIFRIKQNVRRKQYRKRCKVDSLCESRPHFQYFLHSTAKERLCRV